MKRDTALALLKGKTANEQLQGEGIGTMPSNFNQSIKKKLGSEGIGTMPSRFNQSIKKQLLGGSKNGI